MTKEEAEKLWLGKLVRATRRRGSAPVVVGIVTKIHRISPTDVQIYIQRRDGENEIVIFSMRNIEVWGDNAT